jgi:hypothetical protein
MLSQDEEHKTGVTVSCDRDQFPVADLREFWHSLDIFAMLTERIPVPTDSDSGAYRGIGTVQY